MDDNYLRGSVRKWGFSLKRILGKRNVLITLLVGVPIFFFISFSPRGILARVRLEIEKTNLEEIVRIEEQRHALLLQMSRDLDHDLRAIERVARVKYGMVRPGETVYKVKKGS